MSGPDFRVVIPARYASTRLPGKPLLPIRGQAIILHTCERARESGASYVCVATDDERIAEAVRNANGRVVMTSPDHASGTDRLAEVARVERFADDDIVVNLQGDEPFVPGELVRKLALALAEHPDCGMATAATPIRAADDLFNPNTVKVTLDAAGRALYFSRAPIPWLRGQFSAQGCAGSLPADVPFLRHLGLYAYRARTLRQLAEQPLAALERAESLEQLRALVMGIRIHVSVLPEAPPHGVDTPEDLVRLQRA
jgi:3-deoxy-manno-octulosonate cytidylyltransferase (CMP-KDO synthetase)